MEKGNITIAVIDDGINNYVMKDLQFDISISERLKIESNKFQVKENYNHATVCSAIIKKYAPKSFIGSIKILNEKTRRASPKQLIYALYWCVENGIKIVNISLGTVNYSDYADIRKCINDVSQKGLIMIAAANNNNIFTVPACLSNAIGVKCEESFYEDKYIYNTYALDGIDICASGKHDITSIFGRKAVTRSANSYAAPLITAKVYNLIDKNPQISFESIKEALYRSAYNFKGLYYNPHFYVSMDWASECKQIDLDQLNCSDVKDKIQNSDTLLLNLSSANNKKYANALKYLSEKTCKGLVCISDDLDNPFSDMYLSNCIEGKIYNSKFYEKIVRQNINKNFSDIPIPIILLNSISRDISLKISNLLGRNDYYSVIITNRLYVNDYLIELLPDCTCFEYFISYVYKKYNCDILLLDIDNGILSSKLKKVLNIDIEILSNKVKHRKEINLIRNINGTVTLELGKVFSKKTVKKLYKIIIKELNGNKAV